MNITTSCFFSPSFCAIRRTIIIKNNSSKVNEYQKLTRASYNLDNFKKSIKSGLSAKDKFITKLLTE